MSRIFEALQHAERERLQRKQVLEEQQKFLKGHVDRARTVDTVDPHHCKEYAVRVRRKGLLNFLFRLVGMYPWQCSRCHRSFHRFRRKPLL